MKSKRCEELRPGVFLYPGEACQPQPQIGQELRWPDSRLAAEQPALFPEPADPLLAGNLALPPHRVLLHLGGGH